MGPVMLAPTPSLYRRDRVPPEVIGHAVRLYFRFPLSLRMVEEMLAMRGIDVLGTAGRPLSQPGMRSICRGAGSRQKQKPGHASDRVFDPACREFRHGDATKSYAAVQTDFGGGL